MKKFSVVSVDMFRTLVDLASVEDDVWPMLLKDKYSVELAQECSAHGGNSLFKYMPSDRFLCCKSIFAACFAELFARVGVDIDTAEAAKLWARQHRLSPAYGDAVAFLNSVGREYPVCLASDTDDDMLGALTDMHAFDRIFTSEQLGCYKAQADGRFFGAIIDHYGVRPEDIIHIGDGTLEMVGANKAGLTTCWLNRAGSTWSHNVRPDCEVRSLIEAASVLGVNVGSGTGS